MRKYGFQMQPKCDSYPAAILLSSPCYCGSTTFNSCSSDELLQSNLVQYHAHTPSPSRARTATQQPAVFMRLLGCYSHSASSPPSPPPSSPDTRRPSTRSHSQRMHHHCLPVQSSPIRRARNLHPLDHRYGHDHRHLRRCPDDTHRHAIRPEILMR